MPYNTVKQFENGFAAIKNLSPEQKKKALEIFNAIMEDRPDSEEGKAVAIAISQAKEFSFEGKDVKLAEWSTSFVNDLPDSSFAYIEEGGTKDEEGKTVPRDLRKLPYKDSEGKIDLPHLRNALARLPQAEIPPSLKSSIRSTLQAALERANATEAFSEIFNYVSVLSEEGVKKGSSKVELLRVGTIQDRGLSITKEMLQDYVENFKNGVYGQDIPVNLSHLREGEAAGWIKDIYLNGDSLMGDIEWTPLGKEKVGNKLFKFISAELAGIAKHWETGEKFKNVLIGAGLTNIPAMKNQQAITVFSEDVKNYLSNNSKMDYLNELFSEMSKKKELTSKDVDSFSDEMEKLELKGDKLAMAKDLLMKLKTILEAAGNAVTEEEADDDEMGEKKLSEVEEKEEAETVEEEKVEKIEEKEESESEKEDDKDEKLNEKMETISLSEYTALQEKMTKLEEELKTKELSETIEKEYMLSENGGFFAPSDKSDVLNFLMSLSQEQMKQAKSLFSRVRTVDLSVKGSTETSSVKLSGNVEDDVIALADAYLETGEAKTIGEAQSLAEKRLSNN